MGCAGSRSQHPLALNSPFVWSRPDTLPFINQEQAGNPMELESTTPLGPFVLNRKINHSILQVAKYEGTPAMVFPGPREVGMDDSGVCRSMLWAASRQEAMWRGPCEAIAMC
uniref:Uncharacterized protein n=1 Tax=Alexandrium catenella TaxID=2925 RepID=A0A7S1WLM0_ALECA|mmetsp:Transcript_71575/g.190373  ORF Transcript_71575/g.190373 Transcript_71575/m.190373 type:complete len:112 (+) Transcript_71575:50-385(+)